MRPEMNLATRPLKPYKQGHEHRKHPRKRP